MSMAKSEPGSDRVPPSGPMIADTLCSTRERHGPHLTARALASFAMIANEA
jgi:hypothetical protein